MSDSSLETLARAAGISVQWTDAYGQSRTLSDDALHALLETMRLPAHDPASRQTSLRLIEERDHALPSLITADVGAAFDLPTIARGATSVTAYDEEGRVLSLPLLDNGQCRAPARHGYYQLDIGNHSLMLAVAPQRCFGVSDALGAQKQRAWGLGAQVYSLRHSNDGGLGDSRTIAELAETIGRAGGDALALSPLHAMSPVAGHYSPYSPSHRGFLNWLHADPAQVLGAAALDAAIRQSGVASTWQQAKQGKLVDWPVAYALRRNVFRILHQQFAQAPQELRNDLERFIAQGGDALARYARLAARQSQAVARGASASWKTWQEDWRDENAANTFAQDHPAEVDFEIFLQWLTARCWEKACRMARDAGQRIGLIWDLAVGFEAGGGEAWAWREHVLEGLELGAPPDAFNPTGQSWGITSYSPWGLKASGFRPFIELLRANMARGGGIRIDHIIGFQHLWVLPESRPSTEGGYIRQPLQDLLRLTALESWRQRCIVIGEDLGTVPEGLRDILAARGVLGIDVLLFTRDENGDFLSPQRWRKNAVAMTTTHDLPPLMGWRDGVDVEHLAKAQGWDDEKLQKNLQKRKQDVACLDEAMALSSPSPHEEQRATSSSLQDEGRSAALGVEYLAQTPSPLILIPLEDALARKEQPNLPGTVDSHPNWQHRLPEDAIDRLQPLLRFIGTSLKEVTPA